MKKKLLILILSILAIALCVTACSKKDAGATATSISVIEGSVPTECMVGDPLNFTGIRVLVTYEDGSTSEVGYSDVTISSVDTTTAGEKKVTVTYGELSTEFTVLVNAKTAEEQQQNASLVSIKIVPGTVKTTVFKGEELNLQDLQIEATYSDGSIKAFKYSYVSVSAVDTSTAGEKTLTVTYQDKTDSITITVLEIKSMTVVGGTLVNKLFVGQTLNTSNIQLSVTYSDGSGEIVDASKLTIGAFDTNTYGKKQLEITYRGVTLNYNIEVVAAKSLNVNNGSVPTSVLIGKSLDVSNISGYVEYTDDTKLPLDAADLTVGTIDTTTVGAKALKVSYTEPQTKAPLETNVEIKIIGVYSLSVKTGTIDTEILKGEALDLSKLEVIVTYDDAEEDANKTKETLTKDALTIGSIDVNNPGEQKLSITYFNKTTEHTVKVCKVVDIRVSGMNKPVQAGEEIDLSEMKVYGVYDDNKSEILLDNQFITTNVDDIEINSEEDKELVVTYTGEWGTFSTTVTISSTPPDLVSVEITNYPKYVAYYGIYDTSKVVAYAHYSNKTKEPITATISVIDTKVAGDANLTATYTEGGITKTSDPVIVKVLPVYEVSVSGVPSKVDKNAKLDLSGLSVHVTFSDADRTYTIEDDIKDITKLTIDNPGTANGGDQTLTVTYLGASGYAKYHVREVLAVEYFGGLSDTVRKGFDVDYSALTIQVTYSNGTNTPDVEQKKISTLGITPVISGETDITDEKGNIIRTERTVTVTYEGKPCSKTLTVIKISWIHGLNGTMPATVFQGVAFSLDNAKLTLVYENGEQYLVSVSDPNVAIVETINTAVAGTQAIVLTYTEGTTVHKTSVNVLVRGISSIEIVNAGVEIANNNGDKSITLYKGQTIKPQDILVKVLYSDGYYVYVDISDNIKVNIPDTSSTGDKTLSVEYMGATTSIPVKVQDRPSNTDGFIFGALLPDNLVARTSYMKNYINPTDTYIVGDDNPFFFYLDIIQLDDDDTIKDVDGKTFPMIAKVYEGGVELTGDALNAVVSINYSNNSYQFTPAAVGSTFTIEIYPDGLYDLETLGTKSLTVTIVDGYNVYNAWELNLMTNDHRDLDGKENETYPYQDELARAFLASKGLNVTADYINSLNALVIHGNLDVTTYDIPSGYLCSYDKNKDGVNEENNFYDHMGIFSRKLSITNGSDDFSIYGNYYSIYSYNLPGVSHNGYGNNTDEFSTLSLFKMVSDEFSTIFNSYNPETTTIDPFAKEYKANIQDLALRDNDPNSNDQSASERHIRGSAAVFVGYCEANLTHVNIDAYMISVQDEGCNTTININSSKFYNSWQSHLFLWAMNYYQNDRGHKDSPAWESVSSVTVNIHDSSLTKCGGPVILAQNDKRELVCNYNIGNDVNVTGNSELHTYVTGQEAWFVAMGQTSLASQIMAMNQLISNNTVANFTSDQFITGVKTANMVMVNMGTDPAAILSGKYEYSGSYTENGVVALDMKSDNNTRKPDNARTYTYDMYKNSIYEMTGQKPPIFQTTAGATAYTDGETGCYGLETGAPGAPQDTFYQGKYITVYYSGIGIMLEYYNPTNPANPNK